MKRFTVLMTALLGSFISTAYATTGSSSSIGGIADNLLGPAAGLTKVMFGICFVLGVGLVVGGIVQYKYHRENPQQVRLSTPLLMWFLGLILIAIPLVTKYYHYATGLLT